MCGGSERVACWRLRDAEGRTHMRGAACAFGGASRLPSFTGTCLRCRMVLATSRGVIPARRRALETYCTKVAYDFWSWMHRVHGEVR